MNPRTLPGTQQIALGPFGVRVFGTALDLLRQSPSRVPLPPSWRALGKHRSLFFIALGLFDRLVARTEVKAKYLFPPGILH